MMSIKEHRRIAYTGGVIDTADLDWAGTHTLWSTQWAIGSGLDMGEIIELAPRRSVLSIFVEVYDGMGDSASPIAPGLVDLTLQIVTRHRVRGKDVFELGSVASLLVAQRRGIELEVPPQGLSAVRLISTNNLAGDGALWFFAHEGVQP
jgi:hypothetical protein